MPGGLETEIAFGLGCICENRTLHEGVIFLFLSEISIGFVLREGVDYLDGSRVFLGVIFF